MYKFVVALCLVAVAAAQISNEYLPPVQEQHYVQPAHHVVHQQITVPAVHYSEPAVHYAEPAPAQIVHFESAPAVEIEPAHTFSDDEGYRYKTAKRRVFRNRRVFRQRRRY